MTPSLSLIHILVNAISPVLSNLPPIILLGAITFLMLLTTQFLMNSSATVLVLPIACLLYTSRCV